MDLTVMHINKGNAHGTQGERSNPANSDTYMTTSSFLVNLYNVEYFRVVSMESRTQFV